MKSNHISKEKWNSMSVREQQEFDYYWVSTRTMVQSVSRQIRTSLRHDTLNSNSANCVLNKLSTILNECEDKEFVEAVRNGLKPDQEFFKVWDKTTTES